MSENHRRRIAHFGRTSSGPKKSFCADNNFLLNLTSTGIFVYPKHLVIVMADDSPIFEGRVHDVILRLLYQATMHFEGHLKDINMLAGSLERRINTSLENKGRSLLRVALLRARRPEGECP